MSELYGKTAASARDPEYGRHVDTRCEELQRAQKSKVEAE